MVCSKVKYFRYEAVGKPSLNRATKFAAIDPKLSDLSMGRVKLK